MRAESKMGFSSKLRTKLIHNPGPHRLYDLFRTPFGRIMYSRDVGSANITSNQVFGTHLFASHFDGDGILKDTYDLGSGAVTNVGVQALAWDFNVAQNAQTLKLAKNIASGTGATGALASDITLQTASGFGGQTPVAGVQTFVSAANLQKYQVVGTINYTGTEAVTEWGLFTDSVLSITTGTPATATSATSLTATATPYVASSGTVQGQQQHIVVTGTTASYLLILANTTAKLSGPGDAGAAGSTGASWYKTADGTAGTTPGATEAFTIKPVMFDHKVFASIGVVAGDSIQYTYLLTINSGG